MLEHVPDEQSLTSNRKFVAVLVIGGEDESRKRGVTGIQIWSAALRVEVADVHKTSVVRVNPEKCSSEFPEPG